MVKVTIDGEEVDISEIELPEGTVKLIAEVIDNQN
jgi:hypothetical protein